jgi:hypothetical protein
MCAGFSFIARLSRANLIGYVNADLQTAVVSVEEQFSVGRLMGRFSSAAMVLYVAENLPKHSIFLLTDAPGIL